MPRYEVEVITTVKKIIIAADITQAQGRARAYFGTTKDPEEEGHMLRSIREVKAESLRV